MRYLLVTQSGKQLVYHVKACAELFQQIFGGQIHIVDNVTIRDV